MRFADPRSFITEPPEKRWLFRNAAIRGECRGSSAPQHKAPSTLLPLAAFPSRFRDAQRSGWGLKRSLIGGPVVFADSGPMIPWIAPLQRSSGLAATRFSIAYDYEGGRSYGPGYPASVSEKTVPIADPRSNRSPRTDASPSRVDALLSSWTLLGLIFARLDAAHVAITSETPKMPIAPSVDDG